MFRAHDPFKAIYAVRAGMVKTVSVDPDGKEQALGFYLPGEVIGLSGISPSASRSGGSRERFCG